MWSIQSVCIVVLVILKKHTKINRLWFFWLWLPTGQNETSGDIIPCFKNIVKIYFFTTISRHKFPHSKQFNSDNNNIQVIPFHNFYCIIACCGESQTIWVFLFFCNYFVEVLPECSSLTCMFLIREVMWRKHSLKNRIFLLFFLFSFYPMAGIQREFGPLSATVIGQWVHMRTLGHEVVWSNSANQREEMEWVERGGEKWKGSLGIIA